MCPRAGEPIWAVFSTNLSARPHRVRTVFYFCKVFIMALWPVDKIIDPRFAAVLEENQLATDVMNDVVVVGDLPVP
jgi:hypothetical protein